MESRKKNIKSRLIMIFCLIVVLPLAWILFDRFEGEKPSIPTEMIPDLLGASQELSMTVTDRKSGIREIWVGLIREGKEHVLLKKEFPSEGFISGGTAHKVPIEIPIDLKKVKMSDGVAIFRMAVTDYSWRRWFKGNRTYIEKDVIIDTKPPTIEVLSKAHNINQGGTGLVIYQVSEPCLKNGVLVGENYFPGYPGYFSNKRIMMAFIALTYKQGRETEMFVEATDLAGNKRRSGFPHYIKKKVFKKDTIQISDKFLNWKMPEFEVEDFKDAQNSMLEKFIYVNRKLREKNAKSIWDIGSDPVKTLFWEKKFIRLPNSARKAGFADHRSYQYKGKTIDHQVHMGIDLASVTHSPIPAGNNGKIIFTQTLGIYGKTVIIDHGFGLFSMYSHLSKIDVDKDEEVKKGDIIGLTGSTGMAGGDHLHYGMIVHNTFVNPVEWWDDSWIKNNIKDKIDIVASTEKK